MGYVSPTLLALYRKLAPDAAHRELVRREVPVTVPADPFPMRQAAWTMHRRQIGRSGQGGDAQEAIARNAWAPSERAIPAGLNSKECSRVLSLPCHRL